MSRGTGSPGTGYSCSPETRSGARLVAMTDSRSLERSRSATTGAPSITCSKLSRTRRTWRWPSQSTRRSRADRPADSTSPSALAIREAIEARVADRLERHEPHAVGELVGDVGGELERQAGLAGAAGPGQRQQPGRREELGRLAQLRLPPDEARQLGRQVVRAGGRATGSAESPTAGRRSTSWQIRSGRRSFRRCSPSPRMADSLGAARRRRGPTSSLTAGPGRRGRPPATRAARWTSAPTYSPSASSVPSPRVEPHPDAERDVVRPGLRGESPLGVDGGRDRVGCPPEDGEEAVALGLLLVAADRRDAAPGSARDGGPGGRSSARPGSSWASLVEPSMSVNRKVTVPVGFERTSAGGSLVSDAAAP